MSSFVRVVLTQKEIDHAKKKQGPKDTFHYCDIPRDKKTNEKKSTRGNPNTSTRNLTLHRTIFTHARDAKT